jgi:hypothetical protein
MKKIWLTKQHDTYPAGTEMILKEETTSAYRGEIEFMGYKIDKVDFPKEKCTDKDPNNYGFYFPKSTKLDENFKPIVETEKKEEPKEESAAEYDSTVDTLKHIKRVAQLLTESSSELIKRANKHDDSKLVAPEKELYDKLTPILKGLTYGSDEYKASLKELGVALKHHYENNTHHPEHYENGVDGMDLFDVLEMAVDWCAAVERHDDGDIFKSLEINKNRFKMSDQLVNIFNNTFTKLQKDGKIRK